VKSIARYQRLLAVGILALLMTIMLVVPAFATATDGDIENPVALPGLPWSTPQTGTFLPDPWEGHTWGSFWYHISLAKGQTVRFTAVNDSAADIGGIFVDSYSPTPYSQSSPESYGSTSTVSLLPPVTGEYIVNLWGYNPGSFSLDVTATAPMSFKLATFSVPKSVKHKKSYTVGVNVLPSYNGLTSPIKFYIERKSGKRFKPYGSLGVNKLSGNSSYTRFSGTGTISKAGTYRVRGKFTDAAHPAANYTAWKTLIVK
jgi:hypothetical protein